MLARGASLVAMHMPFHLVESKEGRLRYFNKTAALVVFCQRVCGLRHGQGLGSLEGQLQPPVTLPRHRRAACI
jgi:hypothetical protein